MRLDFWSSSSSVVPQDISEALSAGSHPPGNHVFLRRPHSPGEDLNPATTPNHKHEIDLIDLTGAVIQSNTDVVKLESTAEIQGTEVHSSNSISVVRVKERSVLTSQDAIIIETQLQFNTAQCRKTQSNINK